MVKTNSMTAFCDACGKPLVENIDKESLEGMVGYVYEDEDGIFHTYDEDDGCVFYQIIVNGEWKELCREHAKEFEGIRQLQRDAAQLEADFLSQLTLNNSGQLLYDIDTE